MLGSDIQKISQLCRPVLSTFIHDRDRAKNIWIGLTKHEALEPIICNLYLHQITNTWIVGEGILNLK